MITRGISGLIPVQELKSVFPQAIGIGLLTYQIGKAVFSNQTSFDASCRNRGLALSFSAALITGSLSATDRVSGLFIGLISGLVASAILYITESQSLPKEKDRADTPSLEGKLQSVEASIATLQSSLEALEQSLATASSQGLTEETLKTQLEELKSQLAHTQSSTAGADQTTTSPHMDAINAEIKALGRTVDELHRDKQTKETAQLKIKYLETIQKLEAEVEQLKKDLTHRQSLQRAAAQLPEEHSQSELAVALNTASNIEGMTQVQAIPCDSENLAEWTALLEKYNDETTIKLWTNEAKSPDFFKERAEKPSGQEVDLTKDFTFVLNPCEAYPFTNSHSQTDAAEVLFVPESMLKKAQENEQDRLSILEALRKALSYPKKTFTFHNPQYDNSTKLEKRERKWSYKIVIVPDYNVSVEKAYHVQVKAKVSSTSHPTYHVQEIKHGSPHHKQFTFKIKDYQSAAAAYKCIQSGSQLENKDIKREMRENGYLQPLDLAAVIAKYDIPELLMLALHLPTDKVNWTGGCGASSLVLAARHKSLGTLKILLEAVNKEESIFGDRPIEDKCYGLIKEIFIGENKTSDDIKALFILVHDTLGDETLKELLKHESNLTEVIAREKSVAAAHALSQILATAPNLFDDEWFEPKQQDHEEPVIDTLFKVAFEGQPVTKERDAFIYLVYQLGKRNPDQLKKRIERFKGNLSPAERLQFQQALSQEALGNSSSDPMLIEEVN